MNRKFGPRAERTETSHSLRSVSLLMAALSAGACSVLGACGTEGSTFTDAGNGIVLGDNDAGPTDFVVDGGIEAGFALCATQKSKAERVPLDMAIGLDTSFSMDFYNKWPSVQAALKTFVKNPAYSELGLALQFFPIRKQCSVADYQMPAVAMALVPDAKQPVIDALNAQQMSGGTPMVPLLEGLSAYLKTYAASHAKRKPVLVLTTDGIPDDSCAGQSGTSKANTLENAIAVAAGAALGTPPVQTFVIGVGAELSALDAIAQAGGTNKAILVDTSQNVEKAFLKALDSVRRNAIPCDYDIPQGNGTIDITNFNVTYTPTGGIPGTLVYTGSATDCSKAPDNGWYFDNTNNPQKIVLCPGACNKVRADDDGQIDLVIGCRRVEVR